MVCAANDGAIAIEMDAGKMSTFYLRVPDFFSAACSISVDGTRAVVSTNENTAFIFDATGRKLVLRDNEDFELADALRLHPNWRINANLDDSGRFLSDEDGNLVRILRNSSDGWWRKTAMSADGCSLLAGEDDGTFRVFDDKGRATLAFQISTPDHLRSLACDFATKRLLFCDGNGNTSLWSLETGKRLKVISRRSKIFRNYVLSDADNSLLFSLAAVPPSLWDRHGYCLPSLREMRFKAIGASGNRVLVAEKDDLLLFEGGNLLEKRSGLYGVQWMSIPMTADGRIILLWKNEKTALLCDDHLRTFHTLKHRAEISAATLTADGALAAIATNGGVVFLWGTDGTQRQILRGHCLPVRQLAFSADGSTLMAATRSTIRHWRRDEDGVFRCVLELRTESGTRIWLDAETQSLRVDGPDWPHLQLHRSDGAPARSGESIADFGPLAHQRLVNADEWLFAPRDDMG
jgi:WD40 repeat protein